MITCMPSAPSHPNHATANNGEHIANATISQLMVSNNDCAISANFGTPQCRTDANSRRRDHIAAKPRAIANTQAIHGICTVPRDAYILSDSNFEPKVAFS